MKNILVTFFISFLFHVAAHAQDATANAPVAPAKKAPAKPRGGENILDFEAEVIEGEKKRPELFIDIKAGDGAVGSGLYIRPHFDDFFFVDKKRRPRFVKSK